MLASRRLPAIVAALLCLALIACGLLTGQAWYEAALAVFSVVKLMCLAQGRRAGCALGVAYCLAYGALYFSRQVYGLAFYHALFAAPVYAASLVAWARHRGERAVVTKRLGPKAWALALGASLASFAGFFPLLRAAGSQNALWDSLSLSLLGPGLVLLLLRCVENWWFKLAGYSVALILWSVNAARDIANLNFALVSAVTVAVTAMGLANWRRLAQAAKQE
jgi:nicotinamide mononucleotide transporter PnuC